MTTLSVSDVTVGEHDGFATLQVFLNGPSTNAITVQYATGNKTANGRSTGGGGDDYFSASGTLTFAPGETVKTVPVQILENTLIEGPEVFIFSLFNAVNATISRPVASINIVDNDTAVETPELFVSDVLVDEKQGTATFVVKLGQYQGSPANSPITVNFATNDGTALAGQDFVAHSGTLRFEPGESVKTIVVDLIDDALAEPLERFNLVLSNPINAAIGDGAAVVEIGLSDGPGSSLPRISVADATAGERDGYVTVAVRLHAPSPNTVTVQYATGDKTAYGRGTGGGGDDYFDASGTLTFAPGETVKTVQVQILENAAVEGPENFVFSIYNAVNATLGRPEASITIVDNDTGVEMPELFVDDVVVDEKQGTATFVVKLGAYLGSPANGTISVDFATREGTALAGQDFVAQSGSLTFTSGESVKTIVVDLIDDALGEPLERFTLVLSNPVNAAMGDAVSVAEIGASDGVSSSLPRVSVADATAGERDGYLAVVVTLHAPSSNTVTVQYATGDKTANGRSSGGGGDDYFKASGTLTFAPGETLKTVQIQILENTTVEGPENFIFSIYNAVNATISRPEASITVVDNDTAVETPALYVDDVVVDEKQGTATFVVKLGDYLGSPANSTISVDYATRDGTAVAGTDFEAQTGTLRFAPGESVKTVVVDLIDDALAEPRERFNLVLSNPVNAAIMDGAAVAEIGLSDGVSSSLPRISAADATTGERDGYVTVVVTLHAPSPNTVTVQYTTGNQSANGRGSGGGGDDFFKASGSLVFVPGETTKSVSVQVLDNTAPEGLETFVFSLFGATNAVLDHASASVTIVDDEQNLARQILNYGRSDDVYTLSSSSTDFIEAADGGVDTVRADFSYVLPEWIENLVLLGTAVINGTGNSSNNVLRGNSANNVLDGLAGIDTVVFSGPLSAYSLAGNVASRTVSSAAEGVDRLLSIERLQFADTVLASDTTPGGHTYAAYAMLNAAFDTAPSTQDLSQWTATLDRFGNTLDLAQEMINTYAPGVPNEALVTHLWGTIVETPISPAQLAEFVGLIENGTFTQASLLEFVSTYELNTAEIVGIVGQTLNLLPVDFSVPG